jgi:hypothetical protein
VRCCCLLHGMSLLLAHFGTADVAKIHGHVASLERLYESSIDLCSIENVTWGLFKKFRPLDAQRYRVFDETVSSPSLPFVTSVNTAESYPAAIVEALREIMADAQTPISAMRSNSGISWCRTLQPTNIWLATSWRPRNLVIRLFLARNGRPTLAVIADLR